MAPIQIEQLRAGVRGALIQPSDQAYESARLVYNRMIDKRPGLIVGCVDVADVIAAVDYARTNNCLTAIRSGGHNGGGLGTCDGGVVIDLSRMRGVRVDSAARTVRVAPGNVWGDVDHATHPFGLAVPTGIISTTGVGGLTLGGGIGHLARQYGLTIDNLLSADVVLADGTVVTADEDTNPDLFWALRGGGGNFGVVTSFEFRAHPVRTVYAGPTFWPLEQTAEVMAAYAEFMLEAPDYVNGFFAFLTIPPAPMFPEHLHLTKVCGVMWVCTGPSARAEEATRQMRAIGRPVLDHQAEMPLPAVNSLFDPLYPPGHQWYWRADFVKELNTAAIEQHARHGAALPTMQSTMHLYPINGAVHDVAPDATAFGHRNATYAVNIAGFWTDPADNEANTRWVRDYYQAIAPHSEPGGYVNFASGDDHQKAPENYGVNYERLRAVKRTYDPGNLFHLNQNIRP
jgi:FAD/FMN-containing dehydrogenase